MEELESLARFLIDKYWKKLKKKRNVLGYSGKLQPRIRNGKILKDTLVFRVYVSKKEPPQALSKKDLIPEFLSSSYEAIPTDVVEIGEIKALYSNPRERYRPIIGGISAMHYKGTACTNGLLFKDEETGEILVAQNNHCCALENKARIGDPILQPSPYDGGTVKKDKVGELYKFIQLKFNEFKCPYRNFFHRIYRIFKEPPKNKVDIGFYKPTVEAKQEILDMGKVTGKTVPEIGDKVWKIGRTTSYTDNGTVLDLDWNGSVQYSRGVCFFTDCILVQGKKFSQGGDSTSFVQKGDKTIGSLFAGSSSHSIICKIDNIESIGKVKLLVA